MVGRKNIIRIKKSSCVYLDCQINLKESNLKERMSKEKAIEYIHKAKEQLSKDLLSVRFCEMAYNNLEKALKELENE